MARLPYSRVVNVTLTRADAYPSRRGFGVPLLLTHTAVAGELDIDNRTKLYGSMEEVAVDWDGDDDVYLALEEAFGQNPRPMQIKVGYVALTDPATATEANIKDEMDALYEADSEWYWVTITAAFRDLAWLDGLIEWVQAKNKLAILDSNDDALEDPDDVANVAGRNKGQFDRTAVYYHDDPEQYPGLSLAALCGTFNFDQANSAYTAKFKKLRGVPVVNKGSAAVQAITGFTPALGQAIETGNMANTFIDIGGQFFNAEGSTLVPNVFIDETHANEGATITIRLQHTSAAHRLLSQKLSRQRQTGCMQLGFPVQIIEVCSNEGGSADQAFIQTAPSDQKGVNAAAREWVLVTGQWIPEIPNP